jgi:hypothetical protein
MNAHVEISYPELIAALDYERKENARLQKKLTAAETNYQKHRVLLRNERARALTLQFKIERFENKSNIPIFDDKFLVIESLMLDIDRHEDKKELSYVILKLQFVDRFWDIVKIKSISEITRLIRSMINPKTFKTVVDNLGAKK